MGWRAATAAIVLKTMDDGSDDDRMEKHVDARTQRPRLRSSEAKLLKI
jgi:hypothetical protein